MNGIGGSSRQVSAACPCIRQIAISSSTSPRRQAFWHGAGHVRPKIYGNGSTSLTRRAASFIDPQQSVPNNQEYRYVSDNLSGTVAGSTHCGRIATSPG